MTDFEEDQIAKAFISCSLREEDKPFLELIEKILKKSKIRPFGTVGRFSVSPENPVELMKKNIPQADFVVICATPRYLQKDLHNDTITYGLPEMVHVETGMAFMADKPVVVFVKDGTDVGSFIPNITQYVTLNGEYSDYLKKRRQVFSLLNNAYQRIKDNKSNKKLKDLGRFIVVSLAIYGAYKLYQFFFRK